MKFKAEYLVFASLIFAAGCAEERIPSDETDAWEVTAQDDTSAGATDAKTDSSDTEGTAATDAAAPAPDLPDDTVAVLKGSDFRIGGVTTSTKGISGDTFRASHYFAASAPVELKSSVTLVQTELEGANRDGAVPIVGIRVTSTSGKYRSYGIDERPIDGEQILKDSFNIGPGTYKVTISYYKDTVGQQRPTLTLKRVIFRNP